MIIDIEQSFINANIFLGLISIYHSKLSYGISKLKGWFFYCEYLLSDPKSKSRVNWRTTQWEICEF